MPQDIFSNMYYTGCLRYNIDKMNETEFYFQALGHHNDPNARDKLCLLIRFIKPHIQFLFPEMHSGQAVK